MSLQLLDVTGPGDATRRGSVFFPRPRGGAAPTIALLAAFLLLGTTAPAVSQEVPDGSGYLAMEVATIGIDLRDGAPLALLHSEWEQVLPIWIGEFEAQAIALARQGIRIPRPQTHDLFSSVIRALGGTLEEIRVHDLREGTYYGSLHIRVDGELREVDSRPSDALALAVRTGARIRVAARLIEPTSDVDFISSEEDRAIVRIRGMTVSTASQAERDRLGLPVEEEGLLVLHADSPLASRGVRRGDLVRAIGGRPVESVLDFLEEVGRLPASASIPMRIVREGEEMEVDVPPRRPPGRVS